MSDVQLATDRSIQIGKNLCRQFFAELSEFHKSLGELSDTANRECQSNTLASSYETGLRELLMQARFRFPAALFEQGPKSWVELGYVLRATEAHLTVLGKAAEKALNNKTRRKSLKNKVPEIREAIKESASDILDDYRKLEKAFQVLLQEVGIGPNQSTSLHTAMESTPDELLRSNHESRKASVHASDERVPDLITDEENMEVFDLPRQGTPTNVANISKATNRFPDVLIDE